METVFADARRGHPGLFWFAASMVGLTILLAGLAIVDQRTLLGAPLWFKPLKFAISFAAYAGALAWMLGQLRVPALRRTGWVIVVASFIEMAIITGTRFSWIRLSSATGSARSGPSAPTINGAAVPATYCCGT